MDHKHYQISLKYQSCRKCRKIQHVHKRIEKLKETLQTVFSCIYARMFIFRLQQIHLDTSN